MEYNLCQNVINDVDVYVRMDRIVIAICVGNIISIKLQCSLFVINNRYWMNPRTKLSGFVFSLI